MVGRGDKMSTKGAKAKTILGVFGDGEELTAKQVAQRLRRKGYKWSRNELTMYIRFNMIGETLERIKGSTTNYYRPSRYRIRKTDD